MKFIQDKKDSENYIYVSDFLNVEHDEIQADSVGDINNTSQNARLKEVFCQ